jgi:catechol 2,3-dioxygenase-like lactoylglutathione lyase family enzyme
MIQGLNHITIAVNNLDESFEFYVDLLGMTPHAKWAKGAYLSLNELWFCLSCEIAIPSKDYSHLAFDVSEVNFQNTKSKILNAGIKQWKLNKSEGESLYFLDPNGHKLELHVGSLANRLKFIELAPFDGLQLY